MKKYRPFIVGIICGALLIVGAIYLVGGRMMLPGENKYYKGLNAAYGKYYKIIELIDAEALADYDPEKITDKVLKKVVAGLDDPYAEYYTAEEYAQFIKKYSQSYIGIGVTIAEKDGTVYVVDVLEESPAEEAGIKVGDIVAAVDGEKVNNSTKASNLMVGENGTEVKVTVKRDDKTIDYDIIRSKIANKSVDYTELDKENHIGYIRITGFKNGTAKDFKLAVKDLKNEDYDKIIIDLRENGGGATDEAYKVADMLLPECDILKEVNNKKEETIRKSDASNLGIKYVILIDENSASASEMVSGAIKDNKGGKLIGSKTFGKGVTQRTTKFKDGSALKITIEEFFRPSGKKINGVGIEPDIKVSNPHDNDAILAIAKNVLIGDRHQLEK